jgi:hypothetical protein
MKEVTSWADITVGQYQEMMMVENENPISKFIDQISIVLDCDPYDIRKMPYSQYDKIKEKMNFISIEPSTEVITYFEIDGQFYGLEPDMTLIETGVFIDGEQFRQDPMINLHNTLALIFRPIISPLVDGKPTNDYKIQTHEAKGFEKRAQLFKERLSIETVLGSVLFFSTLLATYSTHSLESLIETMKAELKATKTKKTQTPTKKRKQKPLIKDGDSTI